MTATTRSSAPNNLVDGTLVSAPQCGHWSRVGQYSFPHLWHARCPSIYLANLIPIIVPSETAIRIDSHATKSSGYQSTTTAKTKSPLTQNAILQVIIIAFVDFFMVSETITGLNYFFKILRLVTDVGFKHTLTICLFS